MNSDKKQIEYRKWFVFSWVTGRPSKLPFSTIQTPPSKRVTKSTSCLCASDWKPRNRFLPVLVSPSTSVATASPSLLQHAKPPPYSPPRRSASHPASMRRISPTPTPLLLLLPTPPKNPSFPVSPFPPRFVAQYRGPVDLDLVRMVESEVVEHSPHVPWNTIAGLTFPSFPWSIVQRGSLDPGGSGGASAGDAGGLPRHPPALEGNSPLRTARNRQNAPREGSLNHGKRGQR